MAEDYLTVLEVAALMRVDKKTVYRLIWAGDLPRINIGRGQTKPRIRVRRSAIERFMSSREKAA
jgi:excisionase family DNA binding protein